jgi:hypothetical protein
MPVPLALLVDDPCPLAHVYRWHAAPGPGGYPVTGDGRRLVDDIPNAFLERFCDVVETHGMRGKFSIVPAPAWRGDVVRGVNGDLPGTAAWLDTVRRRLAGGFDFSPECITHDAAVDLATGTLLPLSESDWSQAQDRSTLAPYITYALRLLRDAGIHATGVTSPWVFGEEVEEEYAAAIVAAQREVYGTARSWYFLHMLHDHPGARPWVALSGTGGDLVSIPATTDDHFWKSIDSPRTDREFVDSLVDPLLTPDGEGGQVPRVLDAGGWPIILTHWQSLFSNGRETGLQALDELGRRISRHLRDACRWTTFSEITEMTLAAGTPRPAFLPRP